jgi:hypothetical protein
MNSSHESADKEVVVEMPMHTRSIEGMPHQVMSTSDSIGQNEKPSIETSPNRGEVDQSHYQPCVYVDSIDSCC